MFKENATAVLERYPPIEGDQRPQMFAMGTDYVFTCPDRYTFRAVSRTVPHLCPVPRRNYFAYLPADTGPRATRVSDGARSPLSIRSTCTCSTSRGRLTDGALTTTFAFRTPATASSCRCRLQRVRGGCVVAAHPPFLPTSSPAPPTTTTHAHQRPAPI